MIKKPSGPNIVLVTAGLFIKLSFLPVLAMIPLWTALETQLLGKGFSSEAKRTLIRRIAIFVVGPLVVYLAYQKAFGLFRMYGREFGRMQTDDAFPPFHVISIVQVGARTPANLAMTAMSLQALSGGRFLLGLGTSGPQVKSTQRNPSLPVWNQALSGKSNRTTARSPARRRAC